VKTLEEQLESVQVAIEKVETNAQSYGIAGRNMQMTDLTALYNREARLKAQILRQKQGQANSYYVHE
jgi:hypothetical protein